MLAVLFTFQDTKFPKLTTLKPSFSLLQNFSIIWVFSPHITSCLGSWNHSLTNLHNFRDPSLYTSHFEWRRTFPFCVTLTLSAFCKNPCSWPCPSTNISIYMYKLVCPILNVKNRGYLIAEFSLERKGTTKLSDTAVEIQFVYFFSLSQILKNSENDILTSLTHSLVLYMHLWLLIINIHNCWKTHESWSCWYSYWQN